MTREPKVGDRYEEFDGTPFEIVGNVKRSTLNWTARVVLIRTNEVLEDYYISLYDKFIGNYGKADHFEELYNLLNG